MPFLIALGAGLVALGALVALVPLSLVLRYRGATARRRARGWIAGVNVFAFSISATILLGVASLTTLWVRPALPYTLAGLAIGAMLGIVGLRVSRWERSDEAVHLTPHRGLALLVLLVVLARVLYGLWRAAEAWRADPDTSLILAFGPAPSLGAGGIVIGYYLAFWAGVWWRMRRSRPLVAS